MRRFAAFIDLNIELFVFIHGTAGREVGFLRLGTRLD